LHLLHNVDNDNSVVAVAAAAVGVADVGVADADVAADVAAVHSAGERLAAFGVPIAIAIAIASPSSTKRKWRGSQLGRQARTWPEAQPAAGGLGCGGYPFRGVGVWLQRRRLRN